MRLIRYFIVLYRFWFDKYFNFYAGAAFVSASVKNLPPLTRTVPVALKFDESVLVLNKPP